MKCYKCKIDLKDENTNTFHLEPEERNRILCDDCMLEFMKKKKEIACPECRKFLVPDGNDETLLHCINCGNSYWLEKVRKND